MKVEHICCAGLDVHKRTVVVCVLKGALGKEVVSKTKSFGTTTPELMEMVEWLKGSEATHLAMEATGNYWMPIYNLLEGHFELIVANAAHMKAVPGRKSDVQDAEWIADLLRHGLLRSSFIPSREQRDLRELTRHRSSLAGKRAQAANELQNLLKARTSSFRASSPTLPELPPLRCCRSWRAAETIPRNWLSWPSGAFAPKSPSWKKP